jgi:Signal transduction histidine kinase
MPSKLKPVCQKDYSSLLKSDAHTERNESKGGLGLGLSICKQLIKMMGGKIWAVSEPEKGSTFHFVLLFKLSDLYDDDNKKKRQPIHNNTIKEYKVI